jgi:uncharacterized membrane protein YoaK (UPF0700 family)
VDSFKLVDHYSYNSTFITGNFRTAIEGLFDTLDPAKRAEGMQKFRDLAAICFVFCAGAIAGAALSPHAANHTLWLPVAVLIAVFFLVARSNKVVHHSGDAG